MGNGVREKGGPGGGKRGGGGEAGEGNEAERVLGWEGVRGSGRERQQKQEHEQEEGRKGPSGNKCLPILINTCLTFWTLCWIDSSNLGCIYSSRPVGAVRARALRRPGADC